MNKIQSVLLRNAFRIKQFLELVLFLRNEKKIDFNIFQKE